MFIDRFRKAASSKLGSESPLFSYKCSIIYNQAKNLLVVTLERDASFQEFTDIVNKLDGIKKLPNITAYPEITYSGEHSKEMGLALIKNGYNFSGAERLKSQN